jgi:hypothetical protein
MRMMGGCCTTVGAGLLDMLPAIDARAMKATIAPIMT